MTSTVLRRVVRRETHSPRTVATVIALVVVALAAICVGIEIVLQLLGHDPLFVAPDKAVAWIQNVPDVRPQSAVVAGGILVAIAGIALVWMAVSPGRRPRHELGVSSHPVLVDNGVIASAIAEQVRRELDLSKGAVVVGIGHRSADVTVRPEPGQTIESDRVRDTAVAELAHYGLLPRVRVRARVLQPSGEGRRALESRTLNSTEGML